MFHVDQSELVAGLRALGKSLCGYGGGGCDCKYGYDGRRASEQTGCPEAISAAVILAALTPREYARAIERSRGKKTLRVRPTDTIGALVKRARRKGLDVDVRVTPRPSRAKVGSHG